jgi:hypothetical protein
VLEKQLFSVCGQFLVCRTAHCRHRRFFFTAWSSNAGAHVSLRQVYRAHWIVCWSHFVGYGKHGTFAGLRMLSPSHPSSTAPMDSSASALKRPAFGFRQGLHCLRLGGHPRHLTIRSSRPRIVAAATCIRYASTRPPPRCGAA